MIPIFPHVMKPNVYIQDVISKRPFFVFCERLKCYQEFTKQIHCACVARARERASVRACVRASERACVSD